MARRSRDSTWRVGSFLWRKLPHHLRVRARCYSLHHRLNYFAVDDGRLAAVEKAPGRRRDGAAENQSVDALPYCWTEHDSDRLCGPLAPDKRCRRAYVGIPADDYSDLDDGNHLRDVAGRA